MSEPTPAGSTGSSDLVARGRLVLARAVRLIFVAMALLLAIGAVLVALRESVNQDNPLVELVIRIDDAIDGPFSRSGGIFDFDGRHAAAKNALVNWGIGALAYLVVGRVLSRLLTPSPGRSPGRSL